MRRQAFIDWMKALGMFAIVVGHVIGSPYHIFNLVSQPIYTKQLGVCFFIFIMGWSLANEKRDTFHVVFKRAFPIYFYGLVFALVMSVINYFSVGNLTESNYLPLFLGANVFFNFFPANPTTWYIGTYLHVLLFWFLFMRNRPITKELVLVAVVIEILVRAALIYQDLDFVAYMTLPNWLTIFVLGGYLHQKRDDIFNFKTILMLGAWALLLAVWASPLNKLIAPETFPFREIAGVENLNAWGPSFARSVLISFVYILNTIVFFELLRRIPYNKIVGFFARNSLITFILHMPLIYATSEIFYSSIKPEWLAQWIMIFSIFIVCAIVSELLNRVINLTFLQNQAWKIWTFIFARFMKPAHNEKS